MQNERQSGIKGSLLELVYLTDECHDHDFVRSLLKRIATLNSWHKTQQMGPIMDASMSMLWSV